MRVYPLPAGTRGHQSNFGYRAGPKNNFRVRAGTRKNENRPEKPEIPDMEYFQFEIGVYLLSICPIYVSELYCMQKCNMYLI